jgi:site-specific recombinase XerD
VFLNVEECNKFLDSLDKSNKNYIRDFCILTVFLNTGLRVSELYNLKVDMIKSDKIVISGKGEKIRDIFLNDKCLKAINDYLEVRNDEGVSEYDKQYLFLSRRKKRIEVITIQKMVKKYLKEAGFKDDLHTHSLRASFCTNVYASGKVGIKTVQDLMGHAILTTTQRYLGVTDSDKRNAVKDIY